MNYRGQDHKAMFTLATKNKTNSAVRYLAAIYLLTADKKLWSISKKAVSTNGVDFSKITSAGLNPEAYTLLMTAKDFYTDTGNLSAADLVNKEIVSAKVFAVICTAMSICRYGLNFYEGKNVT